MKLILASGSPYRAQAMRQLQLPFEQIIRPIDETHLKDELPSDLATRLAYEKAYAVAKTLDYPALVIGSDQVPCINNQLLSKPATKQRAIQQLLQSSGQTGYFYTACCVYNTQTQKYKTKLDTVSVKFRDLSLEEITAYIKRDEPLDCAGSFKIESLGPALMESVHSDDPTSLVGLGLISLCELLRGQGYDPLLQTSQPPA